MSKTLLHRFTLPTPPSANRWWRKFGTRMVTAGVVRDYKLAVEAKLRLLKVRPLMPPAKVAIDLTWYRARASGDLDKRIGIALDAMQGLAFANDAQVVEIHAYRVDDKKAPRLEVAIYEVAEVA